MRSVMMLLMGGLLMGVGERMWAEVARKSGEREEVASEAVEKQAELGESWVRARVKGVVSEAPFYVGQDVQYSVVVPEMEPELFWVEGSLEGGGDFEGTYGGSQRFFDGEQAFQMHRFTLMPKRAGTLRVPELVFRWNQEHYALGGEALEVEAPDGKYARSLAVATLVSEAFVGEPVLLRVRWKYPQPLGLVQALEMEVPWWRERGVEVLEPARLQALSMKGNVGLPVSGQRVEAVIGEKEITFERVLRFGEEGVQVLGGTRMLFSMLKKEGKQVASMHRYPSYFDNQFFDQESKRSFERFYAMSEDQEVRVLALPEPQPANFFGQFGSCEVAVEVKGGRDRAFRVLDPITVEVVLSGNPHVECLELPPLEALEGVGRDFEVSQPKAGSVKRRTGVGAQMSFALSVRPKHVEVKEFPALEWAFFDVASKEYREVASQAIALKVVPNPEAEVEGAWMEGEGLRSRPRFVSEGFRHNLSAEAFEEKGARWGQLGESRGSRGGQFWWALAALGLPVVGMLAWMKMRKRAWCFKHDPEAARVQYALEDYLKSEKEASDDSQSLGRWRRLVQDLGGRGCLEKQLPRSLQEQWQAGEMRWFEEYFVKEESGQNSKDKEEALVPKHMNERQDLAKRLHAAMLKVVRENKKQKGAAKG